MKPTGTGYSHRICLEPSMPNDVHLAASWIAFILERCQFPDRDALAAQFANAEIGELCECGCNSFAVSVAALDSVPRLSMAGRGYGLVFDAAFRDLSEPGESRSLEILLFTNDAGHLSYVEIDYCGNGLPVPERLKLESTPYHVCLRQKTQPQT